MSKLTEPGRYAATVTTVEFGESEKKGTPFINLYLNTEAGSIGAWLYLSDAALPHTVKTLRSAFDFDGNFETADEQIKGKECSITVENEADDKGVERLRVKWINAVSSSKPIENKESFLKALSQKASRIPKEAPKAGGAPKAAPTKAAPARPAAKSQTKEPEPF
jgi:hypothetical protein